MAGYCGYSKSNSAIEAECDHKLPRTTLCRLYGLNRDEIMLNGEPCEWHHCSKEFNEVDYYDARDFVRTRDLRDYTTIRPNPAQIYNRLLLKSVMIEEITLDGKFVELKNNLQEKINSAAAAADDYLHRRWLKKEDKRLALVKKQQEEIEQLRAARRRDYRECLRQRCRAMGIKRDYIITSLSGPKPEDPCCLASQIRKWFEGITGTIDEFADYGI